MFSKLFGKKKEKQGFGDEAYASVTNLSFIQTDIHSHFVPGIDDGAQTVQDSLDLIREMQGIGYRNIITTPHVKFDHYPNTRETIELGMQTLHHALRENNIDLPVRAAAEYYIDDYFLRIMEEEGLLTIYDNQVLVELSFMFEPVRLTDIFFRISSSGYRPILAHPERYMYFHEKFDIYRDLKERGILLQLNLLSLVGYYGKAVKEVAEKLLQNGLYSYCGTDMHHVRHAASLKKLSQSHLYPTLMNYPFLNAHIP
jgi:tyrosine-protein phosphatase YwqE